DRRKNVPPKWAPRTKSLHGFSPIVCFTSKVCWVRELRDGVSVCPRNCKIGGKRGIPPPAGDPEPRRLGRGIRRLVARHAQPAAGKRRRSAGITAQLVIPGRAEGASPESRNTGHDKSARSVFLDSGQPRFARLPE